MTNDSSIGIIYEDDALVVINKPSGITVNNSETTKGEVTIQDWAKEYLKIYTVGTEKSDFYLRDGIVHRLDKETSGILILAKKEDVFFALQQQFKERVVKKKYYALAHGKIIPRKGEIKVPVGRLPWNRRQFGVVAGGREALTEYEVKEYYKMKKNGNEVLSYVQLEPLTGRTHQIRVHLQYLGFPIFADFLYAGRKVQKEDRKILNRVFLHAAKISFEHPVKQEPVEFEADLPAELQNVLHQLTKL